MFSIRSLVAIALVVTSALLLPPHLSAAQVAPSLQSTDSGSYAEIDEATARKLAKGCSIPHETSGPPALGSQIILQFTVSEKGKLLTVRKVQGGLTHQLAEAFSSCHFAPYKVNGTPMAFQANITIDVK
jgi:hypothetical protein